MTPRIIFFLCAGLMAMVTACTTTPQQSTVLSTSPLAVTPSLPHCTEDRRPAYMVMEIPEIRNPGNAPSHFLAQLHQEIVRQVHKREVWRIVPMAESIDDVVTFDITTRSWNEKSDSNDAQGTMEMGLSLKDKLRQCEINETTGQGTVRLQEGSGGNGERIAAIADGAGWFVENVMLHNQTN